MGIGHPPHNKQVFDGLSPLLEEALPDEEGANPK
jgi:hypothetical protein